MPTALRHMIWRSLRRSTASYAAGESSGVPFAMNAGSGRVVLRSSHALA